MQKPFLHKTTYTEHNKEGIENGFLSALLVTDMAAQASTSAHRKRRKPGYDRARPPLPTGPLHPHSLLSFNPAADNYKVLAKLVGTPFQGLRIVDWELIESLGATERIRGIFTER